jgi:hypothetical protein
VTQAEFDAQCKALCPHCAAGEVVRVRSDTNEWVHDFSFGGDKAGTPFGRRQLGHGICQAHAFRTENKDKISG